MMERPPKDQTMKDAARERRNAYQRNWTAANPGARTRYTKRSKARTAFIQKLIHIISIDERSYTHENF